MLLVLPRADVRFKNIRYIYMSLLLLLLRGTKEVGPHLFWGAQASPDGKCEPHARTRLRASICLSVA